MKVAIDFDCATTSAFPAAVLQAAAREATGPVAGDGVATWGDRAFAYDLNNDSHLEYFVPLTCGGAAR